MHKKVFFMMMKSSMTSQGSLKVGPLYSFIHYRQKVWNIFHYAIGLTVQIALPTVCRFCHIDIEPCLTPENLHQIFSF